MGDLHFFSGGKIGNGAGNFKDPAYSPSREAEPFRHGREKRADVCRQHERSLHHPFRKFCVAGKPCTCPSFSLQFPGISDANGDRSARFGSRVFHLNQFFRQKAGNRNMKIDPVKDRSGDLPLVALKLRNGTGTLFHRVASPSAGAGIACSDEKDPAGVCHGTRRPAHGDPSVLERLPEAFKQVSAKLREFIEEKHPPMGEAYLAGTESRSSSTDGNNARCMVNGPEREASSPCRRVCPRCSAQGLFQEIHRSIEEEEFLKCTCKKGFSASG